MVQQPPVGQGLLILRFHDHTQTHNIRQDSSGRVISPTQRPLSEIAQHSQETDIHAPGGIRTGNRSRRAAADSHLRLSGHWDREVVGQMKLILRRFILLVFWYHTTTNKWFANTCFQMSKDSYISRLLTVAIIKPYIERVKKYIISEVLCSVQSETSNYNSKLYIAFVLSFIYGLMMDTFSSRNTQLSFL